MKTFSICCLLRLLVLAYCISNVENSDPNEISNILLNEPCTDFYEYACGNWSESKFVDTIEMLDSDLNKRLVLELEELPKMKNPTQYLQKMWTFYSACLGKNHNHLYETLRDIGPEPQLDWPAIHYSAGRNVTWPKASFDWFLTIGKLYNYGVNNIFLNFAVESKSLEGEKLITVVYKPTFAQDSWLPSLAHVSYMLIQGGTKPHKSFTIAKQLVRFEQKLIQMSERYEAMETSVDLNQTELSAHFAQLNWAKFLSLQHDSLELRISCTAYINELISFLQAHDPVLISSYLMVKLEQFLLEHSTESNGNVACVADLRGKMELALNFFIKERIFVQRLNTVVANLESVFAALKKEMSKKIHDNRLKFNDQETSYLLGKLASLSLNIGNLPKYVNTDFINRFYDNLSLEQNNYYKNLLSALKHNAENSKYYLEDYLLLNNDYASRSIPFYVMQQNVIIVPYGVLNPPVFHESWSELQKMSILGTVLAHEMVHAFDMNGILFDYAGSLSEVGLKMSRSVNFKRAVNCLLRERTVNINEKIADIVSIRLTYDAIYDTNWSEDTRQQFFVNFAQFYCGRKHAEFTQHDQDHIRVQQILDNFSAFEEAFKCENKPIKCRLY